MTIRRLARACPIPFALAVALTGCPSADPFPPLHPLTGTVSREGTPVTAGGLIFLPDPSDGSGLVVNAGVNPDGTFAAQTSRTGGAGTVSRPGCPAGRYKVVFHPPSDGQRSGLEVELDGRVTVEPTTNTVALNLPAGMPKSSGKPRND